LKIPSPEIGNPRIPTSPHVCHESLLHGTTD